MIPEAEAKKFLEELGITKLPVIPRDICKRLGILYCEEPLKNIDGFLIVDPKSGNSLICVNSLIKEPGRKNFTVAHELGHFCMDSLNQSCSKEVIESRKQKNPPIELMANEYAAELLMPTPIYQRLINTRSPGWGNIKELAAIGQTSLLSTALKFIDLTDYACALIISEGSQISWFHKSEMFSAVIDMDSKILSPHTYAYAAFNGLIPPNDFETVKADNWLSGRGSSLTPKFLNGRFPSIPMGRFLLCF